MKPICSVIKIDVFYDIADKYDWKCGRPKKQRHVIRILIFLNFSRTMRGYEFRRGITKL